MDLKNEDVDNCESRNIIKDNENDDNNISDDEDSNTIKCEENYSNTSYDEKTDSVDSCSIKDSINDNNDKSFIVKEELQHLDSKVNGESIVRLFGYQCPECDFSATSRRLMSHHNSEIHCFSDPKGELNVFEPDILLHEEIKVEMSPDDEDDQNLMAEVDDLMEQFQNENAKDVDKDDDERDKRKMEFNCRRCTRFFPVKEFLDRHMKKYHSDEVFQCPQCPKQCVSKLNFDRHVAWVHKRPKAVKCEICSRMFKSQQCLKRHNLAFHDKNRRQVCNICCISFPLSSYRSHMANEHAEELHKFQISTKNVQERKIRKMETMECDQCLKIITVKHYWRHMKNVHNSTDARSKSLQCHLCPRMFTFPSKLRFHIRKKHEKEKKEKKGPFICECCGETLPTACRLKFHLLVCSKDKKPFPCQECSESYGLEHHLRVHIQKAHADIPKAAKPYPCPECSKTYNIKYSRDLHVRTAHADKCGLTAPFPCSKCSNSYMREHLLKNHIKIAHSTEKSDSPVRFSCLQCSKSYSRKDCLTHHVRKVHAGAKSDVTVPATGSQEPVLNC